MRDLLNKIHRPTIFVALIACIAGCSTEKEIAHTGVAEIHTARVPLLPHMDLVEARHKLYDKSTGTMITRDIVFPDEIRLSPNQQRIAFVDFEPPSSYVIRVYDTSTKKLHTVYDPKIDRGRDPDRIRWVSDSVLSYFFIAPGTSGEWRELKLSF